MASLPPASTPRPSHGVLGVLFVYLLVTTSFFLCLESRAPFYFLQDDNRDHFLPFFTTALQAARSGQIGLIDYYHSLGLPLLSNGLSSVLSPFPYLALCLSYVLFGHQYAGIDLLVFLYFLIGGAGFLYLAFELGLSRSAGLFAACTWSMLPFNVYVATSWVSFAPLVAFFPWIVGLLLRARSRGDLASLLWLASVHLSLLVTGFIQWFLYAAFFELALIALLILGTSNVPSLRDSLRAARFVLLALVITGVLGLPLLLPMGHQAAISAERAQPLSYSGFASEPLRALSWLNGVLFPFQRLTSATPSSSFTEIASPVSITHPGYVTLCLAALSLLGLRRGEGTTEARSLVIAAAALGLVAAAWAFGWIAGLVYLVPVLNRFRWLFKLQAFVGFFLVLLGALGFDRLVAGAKPRGARPRAVLAIGINALLLSFLNLSHSHRGFFEHLDEVPLVEPLAQEQLKGRLFTIGWSAGVGNQGATAASLGFGYSSLWSLHHFGGYDPLMPRVNHAATLGLNYEASYNGAVDRLPFDYLRRWGVHYYVVKAESVPTAEEALTAQGIGAWRREKERTIFEDPRALPLVFWSKSATADGIAVLFRGNRVLISVDSEAQRAITLSLLYSPYYEAQINGEPVTLQRTALDQIELTVEQGQQVIEVEYVDPYFTVGLSVAGLGSCGLLLALLVARNSGRRCQSVRPRGS